MLYEVITRSPKSEAEAFGSIDEIRAAVSSLGSVSVQSYNFV